MSILSLIGSGVNYGLQAYGAYAGMKAAGASMRPAPGSGGRLLTGAVSGAAGYLAGRGGGGFTRGRRRGRGITGNEIRGFNKVCRLLTRHGMVPRKLHTKSAARRKC